MLARTFTLFIRLFNNGTALGLLVLSALISALLWLTPDIARLPGATLRSSTVDYLDDERSFPRRIIDPLGREIRIQQPPRRIVSGILAGGEMLAKLVPQESISSVSYLVDDPVISNVSGIYSDTIHRNHGKIEEFIAAEPDLVIIASYSNPTTVDLLLATGVPVIRFANFHSYDHIRENVTLLAKALGAEQAAAKWLAHMDHRIHTVQQQVAKQSKPRVLYYDLSGSTQGPGSLMDETIRLAGGHNVIAETGLKAYTKISPEFAISLLPDVILLNEWRLGGSNTSATDILMNDPAWQDVPAVRQGRVYGLRGAWLTSGSPFRVEGIEEIAMLLHPLAFKSLKTNKPVQKQTIPTSKDAS